MDNQFLSHILSTVDVKILVSKKGDSMSSRAFTQEEMDTLRSNKYTYSVSPNTISFTIEFKKEFWKRYQSGQSPREIVKALGYDVEDKSENDIMNELPYWKIYDCGHIKYVLNI